MAARRIRQSRRHNRRIPSIAQNSGASIRGDSSSEQAPTLPISPRGEHPQYDFRIGSLPKPVFS